MAAAENPPKLNHPLAYTAEHPGTLAQGLARDLRLATWKIGKLRDIS